VPTTSDTVSAVTPPLLITTLPPVEHLADEDVVLTSLVTTSGVSADPYPVAEGRWEDHTDRHLKDLPDLANASSRAVENLRAATLAVENLMDHAALPF